MNPKQSAKISPDQKREEILSAANRRFQTYGYGKTTMAEIAKDCDMSAANLYRYFENKQDIGVMLAETCLGGQLTKLKQVVDDETLPTAEERLTRFILTMLHDTHHHWSQVPRMSELVDDICNCRREIVHSHVADKRALLQALLQRGIDSGEFHVTDMDAVLEAILAATMIFEVPHFMSFHTLEEFEVKAKALARLLVSGLSNQSITRA